MIIRSIDDLPIIHKIGERGIAENKPRYLEDLSSGALDCVMYRHVGYIDGKIIRDEQGKIISGTTRDELGDQIHLDRPYFMVQVGVVQKAYERRQQSTMN